MEKKTWKTLAIILMVIFALLISGYILYYMDGAKETEKTYECFYEICEEYPDAEYLDKVCSCYDYDLMGELVIAKEKYMG